MIAPMRSPFLVLMALVTAAVACGGVEEPSPAAPMTESSPARSPEKEKEQEPRRDAAPEFTITTFDGGRFSLAEQRGTPVVLNFWESW